MLLRDRGIREYQTKRFKVRRTRKLETLGHVIKNQETKHSPGEDDLLCGDLVPLRASLKGE